MALSWRKRKKLGPLPVWLNLSWSETRGHSRSWTVRLFGVSWNSRTNASTVDLPAGFKYKHKHKH